jgi:hydrogenase expression/formation protein HypE
MLGFDPLYLANEGKLIAFVAPEEAESALKAIQSHQYGKDAVIIGDVESKDPGTVVLITPYGSSRIITMLAGEILPRIY